MHLPSIGSGASVFDTKKPLSEDSPSKIDAPLLIAGQNVIELLLGLCYKMIHNTPV